MSSNQVKMDTRDGRGGLMIWTDGVHKKKKKSPHSFTAFNWVGKDVNMRRRRKVGCKHRQFYANQEDVLGSDPETQTGLNVAESKMAGRKWGMAAMSGTSTPSTTYFLSSSASATLSRGIQPSHKITGRCTVKTVTAPYFKSIMDSENGIFTESSQYGRNGRLRYGYASKINVPFGQFLFTVTGVGSVVLQRVSGNRHVCATHQVVRTAQRVLIRAVRLVEARHIRRPVQVQGYSSRRKKKQAPVASADVDAPAQFRVPSMRRGVDAACEGRAGGLRNERASTQRIQAPTRMSHIAIAMVE
ncbi:hypothetical protein C8F04DRAFT_1232475 [Mycena alexandri]|uniref:Uncharacterized protein n=1 Tax=Mycena alexandri TaxID=1745969 RepID=A0AAD6T5D6_9AGAR|nr:hypothetical protein C8F04DRAFT_1232475 [Mycena alexandri]